MVGFPIYILQLDNNWNIVFPADKADIGHTDFWEQTVSLLIAQHHNIPQAKLANLPYSQRRARIVRNKVYYGETPDPKLLRLIQEALKDDELAFCHDDHERRLREDVLEFRKLVRRYRPRSTTT